MRIGLVCPYDFAVPGGVQNHVLGLAGWLTDTTHEVSIIGPGEPSSESLMGYGLSEEQFTSSGRSLPIKFNGSIARVSLGFQPIHRLRRWLADGDFDVVHIHEPLALGISPWALTFRGGAKVVTCHSAAANGWPWRIASVLQPLAVRRIDAAIAVSPQASKLAVTYLKNPPVIIGNGISLNLLDVEEIMPSTKLPRITFIGRYDEPRKGLRVFLEAIRLVRQEIDVEAIVIGDGSPRHDEGISYLGRLSDELRTGYLKSSSVYMAPQLGNESFGIVLLEAAAVGVPVVASALPAFRDVLSDANGEIAYFFTTGDASAAARAIIAACEPDSDRINRGLNRVREFDWDTVGAQVLQVYEAACR